MHLVAGPIYTAGLILFASGWEKSVLPDKTSGSSLLPLGVGNPDTTRVWEIVETMQTRIGEELSKTSGRSLGSEIKTATALHTGGVRHNFPAGICAGLIKPHSLSGIVAHELIHIKHKDWLWVKIIPMIASIAVLVLGLSSLHLLAVHVLSFVAGTVSFVAYSRFSEWRADKEACAYLSDSDKRANVDWMKEVRQDRIEYRNQKGYLGFFERLIMDANGDYRVNLTSPSLSSRIHLIESTIGSPSRFEDAADSGYRRSRRALHSPFSAQDKLNLLLHQKR